MKRNKLIRVLLCAGFVAVCAAGCGGSPDSDKSDEEVRVVEDADDNTVIAEDVKADEHIVTDDVVEEKDGAAAEENPEKDEPEVIEQAEVEFIEKEIAVEEPLRLSIFGDSISTYVGYIPEGCADFYPEGGDLTDVSQTWWMKLIEDTGMELCSNDSSSGSTCIGESLSTDDPRCGCSDYRVSLLSGKQGQMPDVIIVYMGTNDLLIGQQIGDNDGTRAVVEGGVWKFSDAYTLMLDKIANRYPDAQIYCCTIVPVGTWGTDRPFETYTNHRGLTEEDYSERIRMIADNRGIPVIDLSHCGIEIDNLHEMTSDGVHLTPAGMECVERAVLSGMGFTPNQ